MSPSSKSKSKKDDFVTAFIAYLMECCSSLKLSSEQLHHITTENENRSGDLCLDIGKLNTTQEENYRIAGALMLFCNLHQGLIERCYLSNPQTWTSAPVVNISCGFNSVRTFKHLYEYIKPGLYKYQNHLFIERWVHDDPYLQNKLYMCSMLSQSLIITDYDTEETTYYRFCLDFDQPGLNFFNDDEIDELINSFRNFFARTSCFDLISETETSLSLELDAKNYSDYLKLPSLQVFSHYVLSR